MKKKIGYITGLVKIYEPSGKKKKAFSLGIIFLLLFLFVISFLVSDVSGDLQIF